jgi:hypothetical protein
MFVKSCWNVATLTLNALQNHAPSIAPSAACNTLRPKHPLLHWGLETSNQPGMRKAVQQPPPETLRVTEKNGCFMLLQQSQAAPNHLPIGLLWPRLRKGQELQQPELTLPCYCPHINSPSHWVDLWQTYDWKILKECSGWTRAKFTSFQYAFESIWWAKNNSVITSSESWSTQGIRPVRTSSTGLYRLSLGQEASSRCRWSKWLLWDPSNLRRPQWLFSIFNIELYECLRDYINPYQSISYHPTNSRARWYNLAKHNNDN